MDTDLATTSWLSLTFDTAGEFRAALGDAGHGSCEGGVAGFRTGSRGEPFAEA
jgi:hypothetical protein